MTVFGWDASHYDGNLFVSTLARAHAEGIQFFTHKLGEGLSNVDTTQGTALAAAKAAGIPFLGGYFIPHQGVDPAREVTRCIDLAHQYEPWWADFPGWFWQCDAERWSPTDRPTRAEVKEFCDDLAGRTKRRVICYASRGQYGDDLAGLGHPLWNARYPSSRQAPFKDLYPGDGGAGWQPYSGQTPAMWQYASTATIAGLSTCDANAFRGSLDALRTLIEGDTVSTVPNPDAQAANANGWAYGIANLRDEVPIYAGNDPAKLNAHTKVPLSAQFRALVAQAQANGTALTEIKTALAALPGQIQTAAGGLTADQVREVVREELLKLGLSLAP